MRGTRFFYFFLLLLLTPTAIGADWAGLQAAMLSFVDVESLVNKSMAMCEGTDLTKQERKNLYIAFDNFHKEHLPHQEKIRKHIESQAGQSADGKEMLMVLQDPNMHKQIAEQFLTENVKGARGYCATFFVEMLRGGRMALNFKYYAMQIEEYGTLKIFMPKGK